MMAAALRVACVVHRGRTRLLALAALALSVLGSSASAAAASGNLSYHGSPVLHSSAPYLVFWTPGGESIPAGSEALMKRFFTDVAADSGRSSNVFGVLRQYHDHTGFADYRQTFNSARQMIVDSHPYPAHDPGCSAPDGAYPTCISDAQIQAELRRLIATEPLPTDGRWSASQFPADAPVYFVVLPGDVDVCYQFYTLCTNKQTCAYHGATADAHNDNVLYAVLPLYSLRDGSQLFPDPKGACQLDGTSVVQAPNGDVAGDLMINLLSHEYSETITDPFVPSGWQDPALQNEVGDKCEFNTSAKLPPGFGNNPNSFLPTLGGSEAAGTLYTQLINRHPYYLQSEWSNGTANCAMRPAPGRITSRFTVAKGASKVGGSVSLNPATSFSRYPLSSATWSFGDGSTTAFRYGRATLTRVSHRYRRADRYTVMLTLVDNRGNLTSTTRRVTVHAR